VKKLIEGPDENAEKSQITKRNIATESVKEAQYLSPEL